MRNTRNDGERDNGKQGHGHDVLGALLGEVGGEAACQDDDNGDGVWRGQLRYDGPIVKAQAHRLARSSNPVYQHWHCRNSGPVSQLTNCAMVPLYPKEAIKVGTKYVMVPAAVLQVWPKAKSQVLQSLAARTILRRCPTACSSAVSMLLSSARRATAYALSSGVSHAVVPGKSGRMKTEMREKPTVTTPSTGIQSQPELDCMCPILTLRSLRKSHFQAGRPCAPFIPDKMAPAGLDQPCTRIKE